MGWLRTARVALALWLAAPLAAAAQEEAPPAPFRPGDVVRHDELERLRPWLPPELWAHRDLFFYEGMRLEVAGTGDYGPAPAYRAASQRFRGRARIGPDGSLEGYVAGQPFPIEEIDCTGDPQAGVKIMWDFDHQWEGDGRHTRFLYTYWDAGEKLPLYYEGTSRLIWLSGRVEPSYLESRDGDLLPDESRKTAFGLEVSDPFDSRGTLLLTYRYKRSEEPLPRTRNDDTWVYVPSLRRVRRISTAQRMDAVAGTDFTFDDLQGFNGIVPQYDWQCLERTRVLAPTNSRVRGYPYARDHAFGPLGISFADDRWELRPAVRVRMIPKNANHPYHHKDLYLDEQTLLALYSFAYDRKGELWKVIWHANRWSEDPGDPDYYPGWAEVPEPRDLKIVADVIVNVQVGTASRIERWDASGTPLGSPERVRRYIDVGRLTRRGR